MGRLFLNAGKSKHIESMGDDMEYFIILFNVIGFGAFMYCVCQVMR